MDDALDQLGMILYNRKPNGSEYLGGPDAKILRDAAERIRKLEYLIHHAWIHSGYPNCGFDQMTTAQKEIYNDLIQRWTGEGVCGNQDG